MFLKGRDSCLRQFRIDAFTGYLCIKVKDLSLEYFMKEFRIKNIT